MRKVIDPRTLDLITARSPMALALSRRAVALTAIALLWGCGDNMPIEETAVEMGGGDTGGVSLGDISFGDSGADTGTTDTGAPDTGTTDTGAPDTGTTDTGAPDTGTADTGTPDTGAPDTGTPDTGAPDTGTTDTGTPDTGTTDTGTPDTGTTDTGTTDTGTPDSGTTDTGTPGTDATSPDAGASDGDATGGTPGPNSCVGRCGQYSGAANCQCDSYCTTAGDCCADLEAVCGCVGADCCTKDGDCDDKLSCTTDSCSAKGVCENKPKAKTCAIDGKCVAQGDLAAQGCAVCDPAKDATKWSAKAAGSACDDGQVCTTGDACDAKGACVGKAKSGCCTSDAACTAGGACQQGACSSGTCTYTDKPGCCTTGVCCGGSQIKTKGSACGSAVVATEYQCAGTQVQRRDAVSGCNGSSATTCSSSASNLAWGDWKTVQSCAAGQVCTAQSGGKAPVCETPGSSCSKVSDCNDGNPCTTDTCAAGKCSNQTQAGCCVFASDCDDGNACTTAACANNTCKQSATVCAAPSSCETAACDASSGACVSKVNAGSCRIDGACVSKGAKHPTDGCLVCEPSKSQTAWSLTGVCSCSEGVCCDKDKGRIKAKASTCDDQVQATEYTCSKAGDQVLARNATRGCTGKSNTCSVSKSNWSWGAWSATKNCAQGTVCEVKDPSVGGACVASSGSKCNPSATNACCTSQGTVAPKSTPCDTPVVKSELKCSSANPGGQVQERHAVAGCTGASDTCSSADAYLSWGPWKLKKQCAGTEACSLSADGKTGTCAAANTCDPKVTCCTASGKPAAKGSACGAVVKTEYQCNASGGGVEKRTATGGCIGDAASCDSKALVWGKWAASATCKSGTTCTVGEDGSPGCTADPGVDCNKSDKWEGTPNTASSKKVGAYSDSTPGLILSPKVHLGSATDKDYLTYTVADSSALHEPRVHVEWSATGAAFVCAYARCTKAADGKSCAPVVCPSGTTSYKNTVVSGVSVNGCCAALAKGSIDFAVDAPNTTDDSVEVFFNVKNQAPFCQEVDVKLDFGQATKTQCDPKASCCTASGLFTAKGSKCGTAKLATEYRCTSTDAGGDVESRSSYGGCTGASSSCSTASANRVWSAWTQTSDCTNSQICVVNDKTQPGACVSANDALCKATDKWEGPTKTSQSVNLGSFTEDANAVMVNPMVHLGKSDADWFKYRIVDDPNLIDPRVHISWQAGTTVTLCAYYQCLTGPGGKDCYEVTCPAGSQAYVNSAVSSVAPNGCCKTAKTGELSWDPDAPGLFNTDETGWVFFNVKNAAPVCQHVNVKLSFMGNTKVCGDGKCESGESSSCPEDCGSCANKCGAAYDSKAMCQCDDKCAGIGDCCWDKPLVCGG